MLEEAREIFGPVVMEMASANAKIRHVFLASLFVHVRFLQ
jgi:hypothetical protein